MKRSFVLPTALALAAAGCAGSHASPASAPDAPRSTPASSAAPTSARAAADAVSGTWETPALPTATIVATYRKAGAPPAAVEQFSTALSGAGHVHRYLIRIGYGLWVELEQHDDGTPQVGWSGTYTLTGNTVHATETETGCHLTYQIAKHGTSMNIHLLSDEPQSNPQCGRTDSWPQRSIYESADFQRVS